MGEATKKNPHRYYRPRKNVDKEFNPNSFFVLYGEGSLKEGYEILAVSDKTFSHEGTVASQARGMLFEEIRRFGGNAAYKFNIERGAVQSDIFGLTHEAAKFTASAHPALVVPLDIEPSVRENLLTKFNNSEKTNNQTKENNKAIARIHLVGFFLILLAVFLSIFLLFIFS